MKEKPILFSGPMVRAILEGRKTMTRRVVKLTDSGRVKEVGGRRNWHLEDPNAVAACPYAVGQRLWVRETWADTSKESRRCPVSYRATWPPDDEECRGFAWKPSIHMPRWASRLTLEVTDVRVERVQDITEEDSWLEGCEPGDPTDNGGFFPQDEPDPSKLGHRGWDCAKDWFSDLWDSINAARGYGWDVNPWVWCISFKRIL
jgi:hypothetical protein